MNDDQERRAKTRFMLLSFMRLTGALMMVAGFIVISGKWDLAGADQNRIIGTILVLLGAVEFALMPLLFARQWKRQDRK